MKLINTDGMAFIGPGSEWFWTAISGIVLAVTFVAIYRQLRLQASQGAIEQIDGFTRQWESERMARHRLAISIAVRDGTAYPMGAARAVLNFWEGLGGLIRQGHLDINLFWDSVGSYCEMSWVTLEPYVKEIRAERDPLVGEKFEWLAKKMAALDRLTGSLVVYDEVLVAKIRPREIEALEEAIRVEEALRAVIVASPDGLIDPSSVAQTPPAPAVAEG